MTRPASRERASHADIAAQAKAAPGEWVRVGAYPTSHNAKTVAYMIRSGPGPSRTGAYLPAGSFDTRTEDREFDTEVHARYVGEGVAS